MNTGNRNMVILFDGLCNMCVWSIQFIISRDKKDIFRFASIQSDIGKKLIINHSIDVKNNDSIILIQDGNIKYRSSAVLCVLNYLSTIWKILIIFYIIPSPVRDVLYRIIASTRYLFFGKRDKCMIPNAAINSKFLSL